MSDHAHSIVEIKDLLESRGLGRDGAASISWSNLRFSEEVH